MVPRLPVLVLRARRVSPAPQVPAARHRPTTATRRARSRRPTRRQCQCSRPPHQRRPRPRSAGPVSAAGLGPRSGSSRSRPAERRPRRVLTAPRQPPRRRTPQRQESTLVWATVIRRRSPGSPRRPPTQSRPGRSTGRTPAGDFPAHRRTRCDERCAFERSCERSHPTTRPESRRLDGPSPATRSRRRSQSSTDQLRRLGRPPQRGADGCRSVPQTTAASADAAGQCRVQAHLRQAM